MHGARLSPSSQWKPLFAPRSQVPSKRAEGRGDRVVAFFWPPIPKPKLGKRFFGGTDGRTIDRRRKIEVKNFLPQIVPFDGRTLSRGRPRPGFKVGMVRRNLPRTWQGSIGSKKPEGGDGRHRRLSPLFDGLLRSGHPSWRPPQSTSRVNGPGIHTLVN